MAAILITTSTSHADPELTNVPPHRHYVRTSSGSLVEVGPQVCGHPELQRAFNQFHNNLHVATGSSIGPAAPGLHNFTGADLQFGGC
ncbi:MAG TPA: hypothetical protein VFG84_08650 [Gemmatimonadaceae bacterium]|nr:hypothetical protein [Gemmatimonadaceae bacterium]